MKSKRTRQAGLILATVLAAVCLAGSGLFAQVYTGDCPLSVGQIRVFEHDNFNGGSFNINPSAVPQGQYVKVPDGSNDKISSVQFNLPPGIIVIFFEHDKYRGRQLVVFGRGASQKLGDNGINDKITGWAWFKP